MLASDANDFPCSRRREVSIKHVRAINLPGDSVEGLVVVVVVVARRIESSLSLRRSLSELWYSGLLPCPVTM